MNGNIYHAKLAILFEDEKNEWMQFEVGATARNSLKELFIDIDNLFSNKIKWYNTTQEALSIIRPKKTQELAKSKKL